MSRLQEMGKVYLDAGNYDEAIAEFQAAQGLIIAQNAFFFIGEAYRGKDDRNDGKLDVAVANTGSFCVGVLFSMGGGKLATA